MQNPLKNFIDRLHFKRVHAHCEETAKRERFHFVCWENGFGRRSITVRCETLAAADRQAFRLTWFYRHIWHNWKNHRISTDEMLERLKRLEEQLKHAFWP